MKIKLLNELSKEKILPTALTSTSTKMSNLNSSPIQDLMKCPVCWEFLHPPIYTCHTGHGVCSDCYKAFKKGMTLMFIQTCPICRADFLNFPHLLLELIYDRLRVTCKNNSQGCEVVLYGGEMKFHHKECTYKLSECPLKNQNCNWQGPRNFLTRHYIDNHL